MWHGIIVAVAIIAIISAIAVIDFTWYWVLVLWILGVLSSVIGMLPEIKRYMSIRSM